MLEMWRSREDVEVVVLFLREGEGEWRWLE